MATDLQFKFKRACLEVSGEVGSLAELIGYMQEQSATLTLAFGDDMELVVSRIAQNGVSEAQGAQETAAEPKTRKPRTPKPEAVAPAPLPVPASSTTATLPPNALMPNGAGGTMPAHDGIPPFLDRSNPAAVANVAPALAPPLAPPPPAPVAPPPVGVLGPKVVAALDVLKVGKADGGQALSDWLAATGVTIKGVTYDEACRAVLMISDEKLTAAGIPAALKVAA